MGETMTDIDARVALEVMGWRHSPSDFDDWETPTGERIGDGLGSWSPSTDIAAAWAVVEKMRSLGWALSISNHFGSQWECEFYHPTDRTRDAGNESDTMPLAVCRAALKALCREGGAE